MYRVRNVKSGIVICEPCDVLEAAHLLLTADCMDYQIRKESDDLLNGFRLYTRYDCSNPKQKNFTRSIIKSENIDVDEATLEICRQVLANQQWFPYRIAEKIK